MFETKFTAQEIPYHEFEKVGITKEHVLKKMSNADLEAMLTGRRSGFVQVDVGAMRAEGMKMDVKTSLHRNEDNSVSLRFHPINREAPNIYNLTDEQQNDLKTGNTPSLVIDDVKDNGEKAERLVQYDPETREYVSALVEDIPVPEKINEIGLNEQQKKDWKNGLDIIMGDEPVRVSLTDVYGFAGKIFMFALDGGITLALSHLLAGKVVEFGGNKSMNGSDSSRANGSGEISQPSAGREEKTTGAKNVEGAAPGVTAKTGDSGPEQAKQANPANSNAQRQAPAKSKNLSGTLVDHGAAPYQNKEGEKLSYFVTLEKGGKETTTWGVGLKDAIERKGAERGDDITIKSEGRQAVTVPKEMKDAQGKVTSTENIETYRNEWSISDSNRSMKR